MRLTVIFHRFGPYHLARLEAAARFNELTAIELSAETSEYDWDKAPGAHGYARVTLFPCGDSRTVMPEEVQARVRQALREARPEAVAIPGWSDRAAFVALAWCMENNIPAIVMSESAAHDERRMWWKEFVKRRLMRLYSTALVGGQRHADYLQQLGMPRERIFTGYDVVDNRHFQKVDAGRQESQTDRNQRIILNALPTPSFFLASARFIEKKNLPLLLRAYAQYRDYAKIAGTKAQTEEQGTKVRGAVAPWSLVLLGDGPLREALNAQLTSLNLHNHVIMPGFKQYDELPLWYARAGAFVHASTSEQWGLVVNEAMAAGLPVIVSERCGCAPELVQEDVNGFAFDPTDQNALAACLLKMAALSAEGRARLGVASREIVSHYEPACFGEALNQAAEQALKLPRPRDRVWERALLKRLATR
jgi:1,2-diacylglycerol 3-alpha-glucosyltransferase